jgi:hypothetical protein
MAPYSQNLIFLETYVWAQLARALNKTTSEKLTSDKYSSLLVSFASCEENEVFLKRSLASLSIIISYNLFSTETVTKKNCLIPLTLGRERGCEEQCP